MLIISIIAFYVCTKVNKTRTIISFIVIFQDNWCYYFEKADLTRQFQNWNELKEIISVVIDRKLFPRDDRGWFPFIEGYAHNNEWDHAVALSRTIYNQSPQYNQMLRKLWDRIDWQTESSLDKELAKNNLKNMENECDY
jgi:hypothetical protein